MRFLVILGRIIKYYIILYISTLFIYVSLPSIASTYYALSLIVLVFGVITNISLKNFIFLNIVLASIIYLAYKIGPLFIPIIILIILIMSRDLLLLLRC